MHTALTSKPPPAARVALCPIHRDRPGVSRGAAAQSGLQHQAIPSHRPTCVSIACVQQGLRAAATWDLGVRWRRGHCSPASQVGNSENFSMVVQHPGLCMHLSHSALTQASAAPDLLECCRQSCAMIMAGTCAMHVMLISNRICCAPFQTTSITLACFDDECSAWIIRTRSLLHMFLLSR